jgi:hypothetical protein
MFHMIGSYQPNYINNSSANETSLAVVQFFALATGKVPVHAPDNGFRTVQLVGEERYCLSCMGVRWHDVLEAELSAVSGQLSVVKIARCRVCEKVGEV